MVSKEEQTNKLALIPKSENYIEYMLQMILKLPRTEKYSIGTEYKQLLYIMLKDIIYLSKKIFSRAFRLFKNSKCK